MYERILVPTDGSECAMGAVEHAATLASELGSTVHVVSVVDVRMTYGESPTTTDARSVMEWASENCEKAIEEATAALTDADVAVQSSVLTGIPHAEIVDYVEDHDIDVVVMGTHGRTGIDRFLLGSVAERVLRTSPAPVLTVHV